LLLLPSTARTPDLPTFSFFSRCRGRPFFQRFAKYSYHCDYLITRGAPPPSFPFPIMRYASFPPVVQPYGFLYGSPGRLFLPFSLPSQPRPFFTLRGQKFFSPPWDNSPPFFFFQRNYCPFNRPCRDSSWRKPLSFFLPSPIPTLQGTMVLKVLFLLLIEETLLLPP